LPALAALAAVAAVALVAVAVMDSAIASDINSDVAVTGAETVN
jgi:hypothetical protein